MKRGRSRSSPVCAATTVLAALLVLSLSSADAGASGQGGVADSLQAEIDSLRVRAKYGEAVGVARTLLAHLKSDAEAKPYQLADAGRLTGTLEVAAALPESAREELAEADRLTAESERAYQAGSYALGETAARRALEIQRKLLGEEHPEVATSLDNLATLLKARGDYAGAEPLYRESLATQRKLLGEAHPDVARSLNNLGALL